jgi:pimeloyl-ACP methyl ester carboxylesterase
MRRQSSATPHTTAGFIGPAERRVFAWYHAPAASAARDAAVVLCGPIGSESTGFPRAIRHWAEGLAAAGFATVRFDYHGFGDSAGAPGDSDRLRAWLDSIGDAIAYARAASGASRVILAGVRLGGTLAMAAAAERGDVDALLLWVAFPTGRAYLREGRAFTQLMGAALDAEHHPLPAGAEQIGGLMLTAETIEALDAFDPLAGKRLSIPTLLIPRDASSTDAALTRSLTAAGAEIEREVVDGYAVVMTEPHQSQVPTAFIGMTVDWLRARFDAPLGDAARAHAAPDAGAVVWQPAEHDVHRSAVVESPVHVAGDRRLFGIASAPAGGERRATGILLLNAGSVSHVGPNRVYVDFARRWASHGYTVIRMDIGGIGDSPAPNSAEENQPYPAHVIGDIEAGLAELRSRGVERVVVAGLCSGAHATFHAGRELDSVDGMIVINPIVFYWKPSDPLDVGAWKTYVDSRYYKQSARSWRSWVRLAQGRVNVQHIASVGVRRSAEVLRAKLAAMFGGFRREDPDGENAARDLSRIASSGTEVLLVFSEGDPGLDFLTLRYGAELRKLEHARWFELVVIDHADHTFTAFDARRRASDIVTQHLLAKHP